MLKSNLLKLKSRCYILFLGILNIFAFSFISGCANNTNNKKDNTADSIARVKKINDSLAKAKHKQDSLAELKTIHDTVIPADSIKKSKPIKIKYKPPRPVMKYGVIHVKY